MPSKPRADRAASARPRRAGRAGKKAGAKSRAASSSTGAARVATRRIRYAVVGAGYITQSAMLPAFGKARRNSELVAIVSDDPVKRDKLARNHGVKLACDYDGFDQLLQEKAIDAVFIGLPNHLHAQYAIRSAGAGIHVLCDKPLAVSVKECQSVVDAVEASGVKFMVAYRLHFEPANLAALKLVRAGRLGVLRFFSSDFSMQVEEGNIRLRAETGGGTLHDLGVYCINAARTLFGAEPEEVSAFSERGDDPRFREVDEMTSAVLRFPGARLASFTTSFGAGDTGDYRIVGTKGDLLVRQGYGHADAIKHELSVKGRTSKKTFPRTDQFAAELLHFSDCILKDEQPGPSVLEGLADVRVVEALLESAREGRPVRLAPIPRLGSVDPAQEIRRPPSRKPKLIRADDPRPEAGEAGH